MKRLAILCVLATVCGCGRSHDGYTDESLVARITAMEKRIGQTESSLGYVSHVQDVILQANRGPNWQLSEPPVSYCGPPPFPTAAESLAEPFLRRANDELLPYQGYVLQTISRMERPREFCEWIRESEKAEIRKLRERVKQLEQEVKRLKKPPQPC